MWTALALWLLTIGGVALYAAWAAIAVARGLPVWLAIAGGVATYGAVIAAFMTLYCVLAWVFRSPRPRDLRIGIGGTLRLLWNEFRALTRSGRRMMLYRRLIKEPPPGPATLPVLLVHGVLCNAGVWQGFARRLALRGIAPVYAISYGPPLAPIETFADQLAARIDAILAATGARDLVVVSHSMGGLVALAYCRKYGAARIRRAISLATPYRGSVHAWCFFGACLAQLRPGNGWLAALNHAAATRPPLTSIWSWHDTMVAPQTSSRVDGADNVELTGVGHNAMLADAGAFEAVVAAIGAARGAPSVRTAAPGARATSGYPA